MVCSLAKFASAAQTEPFYLACFAPFYFSVLVGLLGLLCSGRFARTALGSLARELTFLVRTMHGLRDLRKVRLARLLAELASLVPTELELKLVCDGCELAWLYSRVARTDRT